MRIIVRNIKNIGPTERSGKRQSIGGSRKMSSMQNVHLSLYDNGVTKVLLKALPAEKEWEVLKLLTTVRCDIDIEYLDLRDGSCVIMTYDGGVNAQIEKFALDNGYSFTTD